MALTFPLTIFYYLLFISHSNVDLPSSCIGLEDGTYSMKLINNDIYPIISVQCSNEYMIINALNDPNWSSYFTSWIKYHYAVVGPIRNDLVNWNEWFIPSTMGEYNNNKYLLSLDCSSCDPNSYIQKYNTDSTFYLSALAFGCFNPTRGWPSCDMDYDTYKCRLCHWNEEKSQIIWTERNFMTLHEAESNGELTGVCDFEIRKSTDTVLRSYHECTTYIPTDYNNFKPSIGIDGTHCQCFKPQQTQTISVTEQQYNVYKSEQQEKEKQQHQEQYTSENHIVDLTQSDFERGTFRIIESGTYIITEDITFNFNSPNDDNPLSDGAFWPNIVDGDMYPGAGQSRDAFCLGFFAGITIETDDVILDLNGFTLKMSFSLYYSQAFFSIIELGSQPFLPQQGPGFFGSDPVFATNVEIKNGILGLSSHHGIHGNYNSNIMIKNVIIRDFQTHGIQLNGYNDITLSDVEIGPSSRIAYLNGNYGQLRELLPTLRKLGNKETTKRIRFNGRESIGYTMNDLLSILEPLMIKAFNYAYYAASNNDIELNILKQDKDYSLIQDLFINNVGLPYGAVTYGIFLNHPSAGIFGWHVNDAQSNNAVLNNIHIHDIHRAGDEVIGLAQRGRVYSNAFNGPLPLIQMLGGIDKVKVFADALLMDTDTVYAQYVGDIVTDIHIAMYEFGRDDFNNWFGIPYYGDEEGLLLWAKGENKEYVSSDNNDITVYCNNDAMFHPNKGLLGMKISVSKNVILNGIYIDNLIDDTHFGHDLCGKKDLYHFSQQSPYQIGFSMNMVHGIAIDFSDVTINDDIKMNGIYSRTGLAFGISIWFDSQINHNYNYIEILNVYAGYDDELNDHSLTYNDRPNKAPEACAIRIHSSDQYQVTNTFDVDFDEMDHIKIECINGDVGCYGNNVGMYTNLGNMNGNDNECQRIPQILQRNKQTNIYSTFDTSPFFYTAIGIIGLICLVCSKKLYHDYPKNFKYSLLNTSNQNADDEIYGIFE